MYTFGTRLRTLRKNLNLTQQELADYLGVSKSMLSYYESSSRYPSYDILIKIARIFRVTTDYLLGVNHGTTIDVTDLLPEDISVLLSVAESMRKKERK